MSQIYSGELTRKDCNVALSILTRMGMAGIEQAALHGGGPETERLAAAAESVARVVEYLRETRERCSS